MSPMQIYTFEHYRPAFPQKGNHAVIHRSDFESNRECFSASLVRARDFYAANDTEALTKGQQAAATIPATFGGFNE